jgi:ribosomal protein L11 methyltransferase
MATIYYEKDTDPGVLAGQADDVAAAYAPWFRIGLWDRDEDWVALAGVRNTDPAG